MNLPKTTKLALHSFYSNEVQLSLIENLIEQGRMIVASSYVQSVSENNFIKMDMGIHGDNVIGIVRGLTVDMELKIKWINDEFFNSDNVPVVTPVLRIDTDGKVDGVICLAPQLQPGNIPI